MTPFTLPQVIASISGIFFLGVILGFYLRQILLQWSRDNELLRWIDVKKHYIEQVRREAFQRGVDCERKVPHQSAAPFSIYHDNGR